MRVLVLVLFGAMLCPGQQAREGNAVIRFEPTADLQPNAEIPFAIRVNDDLHKPVLNAKVTLQIQTPEHTDLKIYRASPVEPGVYIAKPVFPSAGQWSIYVEVRRDTGISARSIDFNVPASVGR